MCLIYFRVLFETRKNDDDLVLRAECPILNKLDFEVNIKRVVSNTLPDGIPRTDVTATLQPVKVSTVSAELDAGVLGQYCNIKPCV